MLPSKWLRTTSPGERSTRPAGQKQATHGKRQEFFAVASSATSAPWDQPNSLTPREEDFPEP